MNASALCFVTESAADKMGLAKRFRFRNHRAQVSEGPRFEPRLPASPLKTGAAFLCCFLSVPEYPEDEPWMSQLSWKTDLDILRQFTSMTPASHEDYREPRRTGSAPCRPCRPRPSTRCKFGCGLRRSLVRPSVVLLPASALRSLVLRVRSSPRSACNGAGAAIRHWPPATPRRSGA